MMALVPLRSRVLALTLALAPALGSCVPEVALRRSGPDAGSDCSTGETREGSAPCGLNGRGRSIQECHEGRWVDRATCEDPDECQDLTVRGSCAEDAGQACVAGQWSPGPCEGCGIVDCASTGPSCCAGVVAFVLDTAVANFADRPDLLTSFMPTDSAIVAHFEFDAAGQRGVIGFDLPGPTTVEQVAVSASRSGASGPVYVTLDSELGANGCAYELYLGEIDLYSPLFCWGAFNYRTTTRINVRVDSTLAAEATLSVQSVAVN